MEENLHLIFVKDPKESLSFVNSFVKIILTNGEIITGTVYTIDPVSQSVILLIREPSGDVSLKIVLQHSISCMEKLPDVPESQRNVSECDIFKSNKPLRVNLKNDVKDWLEKNMIPVLENGDKLIVDTLEIHPPYGVDDCFCSNSIVLSRIQHLLKNMPVKCRSSNI